MEVAKKHQKILSMNKHTRLILFVFVFAAAGATALLISHAATSTSFIEPETGAVVGNATVATDPAASNGKYVLFNAPAATCAAGQIGTPPNCVTPPGSCPPGQVGTPPNCTTPVATTTLPPGSALPDDATCSARVSTAPEIRPQNATQNATAGHNKNIGGGVMKARVSGAFAGTTDEIIQWVACKWGIDPNIVRAQAAKESYWTMSAKGDWTTDANSCPPAHGLGVDGTPGQCPESYSIIQNRWNYLGPPAGYNTWPEVETSTAYALDLAYASWRDCFEGNYGWLNTVDHTGTYAAGDAWGCVGVWFAGRWKTDPANTYISAVQTYFNQKIWTDPGFISYR